ncbi:Anaphase-promoting complex subunit 2 [Linderina pennispora]|nr:Anaphase-promoting complex subunit 2 [Linderina pennispora]
MVAEESELFEDLASGGVIEDNEAEGVIYDEDTEDMEWEPLPVEAKAVYLTAQRRDADVLSLLVSIFDTKDVFVEEFEKHLARQLLLCADYETQREIKQVEMMKLRFGDEALERCEVMLKDLADSKRADQYIAEVSVHNGWEMPMHTTVVSRQFWGSVPSEQFTMPAEMASLRDRYSGVYESLKAARKLEWRDALGTVTLEIGLADRTLEVSAKPAQVAVLYVFSGRSKMTLAEVSQALECSEEFTLPRIRFWQARGVIRETSGGVFEVAESEAMATDATGNADKSIDDAAEEDGLEEAGGDGTGLGAGAHAEALRVHFKYVVGMLTNFGPLPLDRIHSMLGMFLPGEKIELDELKARNV